MSVCCEFLWRVFVLNVCGECVWCVCGVCG